MRHLIAAVLAVLVLAGPAAAPAAEKVTVTRPAAPAHEYLPR